MVVADFPQDSLEKQANNCAGRFRGILSKGSNSTLIPIIKCFYFLQGRKYYFKSLLRYLSPTGVQISLVAQSCPTLCDPMNCSTPGLPTHHQVLEFTQTHVHRVSNAIQPFLIKWPKYWSFSFSISPSNEYSSVLPMNISFRMDWCISWQSK